MKEKFDSINNFKTYDFQLCDKELKWNLIILFNLIWLEISFDLNIIFCSIYNFSNLIQLDETKIKIKFILTSLYRMIQ